MLANQIINFIPIVLLTLLTSLLTIHYSPVHASTESIEITQIPSEPTDYPGNNDDSLQMLFSKATIRDNDSVHVIGSLKNVGQQTLQGVEVTAHFFDADNNTVGVTTCCYADPSDIEPGHTSAFDSFSNSEQMAGEPTYYRLSFDWRDSDTNIRADTINSDVTDSVSCKDITADFTLPSNLYCSSDGFNVVNQDGLVINLNGFTIYGPGIQDTKGTSLRDLNAGIRLEDSSNIVIEGPGTITDFDAGVLIDNGENNQISRVTFTENEIAVFDSGSRGSNIEDNLMFGNDIGYAGHSSNNGKLLTNLFKSNDLAGATFVSSRNYDISLNTIQGSINGIFLDSPSRENSINSNNVLQNTGVDLNNANGLPLESTGNTYLDNNCNTSVPDGLCSGR